ncbi:MAG: L,D-transpeptidase, partial [Streptosporangiaceae bacterium]
MRSRPACRWAPLRPDGTAAQPQAAGRGEQRAGGDNWPISSGRPGDATPDGSYLTIEKANPVLMTGPGYSLEVPWSVRFTFSGDYYHDAYWSVGEQGFENVSHGCVNLSPADAEIYYKLAVPG